MRLFVLPEYARPAVKTSSEVNKIHIAPRVWGNRLEKLRRGINSTPHKTIAVCAFVVMTNDCKIFAIYDLIFKKRVETQLKNTWQNKSCHLSNENDLIISPNFSIHYSHLCRGRIAQKVKNRMSPTKPHAEQTINQWR